MLSTFGKIFTKVLNDRLNVWAEMYHVYIEAQAGFRQHMGTVDVDFTKAFDYLVRDVIWYKLIKYGVRGKMWDIIKSMYEHVRSSVKYNNETSDDFSCCLGVRQGESFSPFLFSMHMYLNDVEEHFISF